MKQLQVVDSDNYLCLYSNLSTPQKFELSTKLCNLHLFTKCTLRACFVSPLGCNNYLHALLQTLDNLYVHNSYKPIICILQIQPHSCICSRESSYGHHNMPLSNEHLNSVISKMCHMVDHSNHNGRVTNHKPARNYNRLLGFYILFYRDHDSFKQIQLIGLAYIKTIKIVTISK